MAVDSGIGIIGLAASIGIGLLFLIAGGAKLRHRIILPGVVANYRVLPNIMVGPVAVALPYVEIILGCALIAGFGPLPPLVAIALLLTFAAAILVNVRRGRTHIDCGCGLPGLRQPLGRALAVRNLVLASLLLLRLPATPPPTDAGLATAAAGGVALLLCTFIFNAIDALSLSSSAAFRR